MTFARMLMLLQLCVLAGCHGAHGEEDRHGERRRVSRQDHEPPARDAGEPANEPEPASPPDAGLPTEVDAAPEVDPIEDVTPEQTPRWILDGEVMNARDLGGVPLDEGRSVKYGALFRGPPLAILSPASCEEVERLGIRTVIDFRMASERGAAPESACVAQRTRVIAAPFPIPYSVSPLDYVAIMDTNASIVAVFEQLGDADAYPIYVHCTWGRDRTGVLAAIILSALGASREQIMQEYLWSKEKVGAYPNSLVEVLDTIERRGGIEEYLRGAGVGEEALATLRKRAVRAPD